MKCLCSRKRKAAKALAARLVESLCTNNKWKPAIIVRYEAASYMLGDHEMIVTVMRHRLFRLLDPVYVSFRGSDLWFPLLWRLRIRCAVRWRAAVEAGGAFDG